MRKEKKLSKFDLFTRRKKEVPGPVKSAKEVFTYRGDRYNDEAPRQLKYLLGIIKNYNRQYAVMILRDNEASAENREVMKLVNGRLMLNRIPDYAHFLSDFYLPEQLSYEIK